MLILSTGLALASTLLQEPPPRLPTVALDDSDLDERCIVAASIDAGGHPYWVDVSGCSEAYAETTREAAWRWVFDPGEARQIERTVRYVWTDGNPKVEGEAPRDVGVPPAREPMTLPLSTLVFKKRKEPDITAPMLTLEREQGVVEVFCLVHLVVSAKGKVEQVTVGACHPTLSPAIEKAVASWRFEPALIDGAPMPFQTWIHLPVRSYGAP